MRPESQSLPSPFQQSSAVEHHARAVAAVAEAQRQEDLLEHEVSFTLDSATLKFKRPHLIF